MTIRTSVATTVLLALKKQSSLIFFVFFPTPGSHLKVYFGPIVRSGSIPPPFAVSVRGTIPTVALPVHR